MIEEENEGIIKIGRTHLQDATPLYFSQELSGYRSMIEHSKDQIVDSLKYVYELACGATAVGTGINCPEGFDEIVTKIISEKPTFHLFLIQINSMPLQVRMRWSIQVVL